MSKVVDTVAIDAGSGRRGSLPPRYGVGGWGMAINADIAAPSSKEAAWAFIKWLTSPAVHKDVQPRGRRLLPAPAAR